MLFNSNIQYLRQVNRITQEQLAEKLAVSRQTISKWESGEALPEISKLMELSDIFHCKLDELLKENMKDKHNEYSDVTIKHIEAFQMARYVMISPNPEDDVNAYMDNWERQSGLSNITGEKLKRIGWDFPYVSNEQQNRFGLRGYVSACIIPDEIKADFKGVEIARQEGADYACISIRNPFSRPFELIPCGYRKILDYLKCDGFKEDINGDFLSCFEYVHTEDGIEYMDIFIHVQAVGNKNLYTTLR